MKLLPFLMLTFMAVAGSFSVAKAQRNNLSDWNVPPPLPPGTITKGNATGKVTTGKTPALTLSDIPSVSPATSPPVQVPVLAAISTTPPVVNSPDQPAIESAGLPEIPSPVAPDAPAMPKQSLHDTPIPSNVDLPVTPVPEIPTFPPAPTSLGQTSPVKTPIPLMPDMVGPPPFALHPHAGLTTWSIPGIPENINLNW